MSEADPIWRTSAFLGLHAQMLEICNRSIAVQISANAAVRHRD